MSACHYVDLGFAQETELWLLKSHLFPSKIGGKPSWLALKSLPSSEQLKCGNCGEPCIFLLQIYSPVDEDLYSFHRTIFIFICRNLECHKSNHSKDTVLVFRSSLPKINSFYSSDPPNYKKNDEDIKHPSASDYNNLCVVCGCVANKKCSQCLKNYYCSKQHQIYHWKAGHKALCTKKEDTIMISKILFHEYGIKLGNYNDENDNSDDDDEENEDSENQKEDCKKIEKIYNSNNDEKEKFNVNSIPKKELKNIIETLGTNCSMQQLKCLQYNSANSSIIQYFIQHKPIVEYARGGILIFDEMRNCVVKAKNEEDIEVENSFESKIPKCTRCNSERVFEFLVTPHLLSILDCCDLRDSVGWLAVFTCKNSCSMRSETCKTENFYNYFKEFSITQTSIV